MHFMDLEFNMSKAVLNNEVQQNVNQLTTLLFLSIPIYIYTYFNFFNAYNMLFLSAIFKYNSFIWSPSRDVK